VSAHVKPVNITILGKEYKVACTADEQENLLNSARKLDRQMREIQDAGRSDEDLAGRPGKAAG
jgi:cell division protein ZapA